jgi:hypothetical protein
MLEPRVVSLQEGDAYINKSLSFSKEESKTNSASIRMLNNGLDLTPPVLAEDEVLFRFVDVVNAARLRGARNLLIVDVSCAAVCDTNTSWLRRWFPTRTCLALMDARLAGGGAAAVKSRRQRQSRRRQSRRRSTNKRVKQAFF